VLDDPQLLAFGTAIATILAGRVVHRRGLNRLPADERRRINQSVASLQILNLLIMAGLAFLATKATALGIALVLLYFLAAGAYSRKLLNNLTVSEAYSWNYSASLALQLVGLALALGAVVWF
jgi:hypothetical protein